MCYADFELSSNSSFTAASGREFHRDTIQSLENLAPSTPKLSCSTSGKLKSLSGKTLLNQVMCVVEEVKKSQQNSFHC